MTDLDERRQMPRANAAGLLADPLLNPAFGSEAAKTRDERIYRCLDARSRGVFTESRESSAENRATRDRVILEKRSSGGIHYVLLAATVLLFAVFAQAAQSAFDLMDRANALYRDGKFKQAVILYRKAAERGADPIAVSFNIANSYYQTEKYPEAAAAYRKAVDFSGGKFAPALFNMASVYFRLRQYPECIAAYHRALKLEPENVSGWLYLGEAYSKTGDKVGALRAIEKAYALDKSDISIVYQLSEASIALDDFDRATAVVREGYTAHPDEVDFLVYLGDVYRLEKDYDRSAGAYREALSARADDVNAMYKLADVLVEDGKQFVAMDVLNSIVQIKPDFSDAAIFLGNLAYDAKFFDRAEFAYELAAQHGNAEAIFGFKNMAYDAHQQKRDDEAVRLLKLAQKYYPDDATLEADLLDFE
ncbi:MAG: tetratricopeptide repeat protein [Fibrobacter sp.]|nr:tetratricopeptide repeat protein [Fibrobacter sp.]